MRTFLQIFAVARTEFRFGLRRGAPVVVTALIGLILGAALLLDPIANLPNFDPRLDQFSPEQIQAFLQHGITAEVFRAITRDSFADLAAGSAVSWWGFIFLALASLPVASIGAIPADRSFGAWELLRGLPVRDFSYLAGKILGLCFTAVFISLFPLLLFFTVLEGIFLSKFQLGLPWGLVSFYMQLTLFDALPLMFFSVAVGVLVGVIFRSRRVAILPGFGVGLLCFLFWTKAFKPPPFSYFQFDLAAYRIFQGYHSLFDTAWARVSPDFTTPGISLLGAGAPFVGISQVLLMYLFILMVVVAAIFLADLWLKRKEGLS
jgi:hypothetical protein